MLYENYQKKIEQRKKFKDFLKRFRIYLITVGVTLLAVFFTLFSVKGIITDQLLLASSYSYGNSYGDDYSSSAFMGSAKYEFALKDSDSWSENAPYLAGDYKMRAYAYNNYGKKYYGNIQYFSISKQPVTLSIIDYPNGIDYGNKPAIVPEGLVSGDKIESYEVSYTDISKDVDTLECQVDVSSVVIKNSADEDVTSCYDFTSEKKNIKVIDRLLDITYESATKEYDGKPLIASGYEITRGSLLSGDRFASLPHADSSYTDVGEYKNSCSSLKILNSADEDVTNRYSIGTGGTLSITPRQVSVQTRSQSFEYDGKGHYLNEMDILSGSLISGDSLILTYNINKDNPVTEVGIYDNDFAVYAADSEGDPNMSNYCITMNSGTISITKRPLHIQTTRDYFYDENGLVLEASDYQFKDNTSLAEGNRLSLSYKKEGEESAFIYHIYDKDNNDVTSQYEVMINDDAVPGRKRNLNFVFDSKSKVYDGTPLESKFVFDSSEVADRDQINTVSETIGPEVTVKSDFLVCDYQILDKEDNSDHSEYYNITTTPGSLEIIKKPLAISINSFSKVYDEIIYTEIPLEESDYILDSNDKDFLDSLNHTLTVSLKSEYYLLNPGEITDPNAYTARISDAENNDVTSNYSISFRLNGVFITKRKVNITSSQETYDFYYDTQEIDVASALNYETSCDPEIEASGLISGHTLFFAVNEPITEPGTYDLSQYVSFKITSGNIDVTSSYDINVLDYGKVKVNKYRIIVQAPSYIYDGTDKISSSEKDYTYQNIPQGYSPSVTFDSNLSPVESEDKEYQVYDKKVKTMVLTPSDTSKPTLYYDRSQSLDSDFEVDDALSSLLIKKREVTVNFSGSYFYSGVSYEPDEIEFESLVDPNNPDTGLLADTEISFVRPSEVSLIGNNTTEGITYDSETLSQLIPVITCSGADVSKFYKVKVTGSITVKKASVMLTMNDYFANEGTGLFSQNDDFNFPCSVQLGSSFSKKNLSLYSLTINIANPESNDPSALSDIYFTKKSNPDICILKDDIEYVFIGKAASSQKHVIINFDDTAKGFSVYDGREVDPADSQYWEYTSTSTFSNGHKLKFDYSLTILEIGSYDMSYSDGVGENLNNVTVLDENNNDVTKLYSIEVTGSFTIRKGLVVFSGSDFVTDNQSSLHYENTFTDSSKVLPVSIDLKKSVLNPAWEVSDLAFSYSLKTEASQLETPTSDNVFTLNSLAVYGTSVSFDNGNLDYEFDTSDFTASLTKKEIALDFGVVSQVFNGKDLDLSQLNVPTDTNSVLGQDESIEISGTLTKENTGILSFQNLYQNNILLIKILDKDDNDITSFFDISISGTLYFDRITIDFNCDATKTEHIYDGKQISLLSSYFTARIKGSSRVYEGGKISSFTVNNSLYPFVDAGSYSIEATQLSYTFTDAQGNVIDSQYVNTLINGKSSLEINIEKRDLIFDFGSKGYIYDGQEKDLNQIFTSALEEGCSLADGDVLSLEYGNSICDEGEYDLSQVIIKITNSSGKDVTSNYNISLKNSNIYVEKAVVNVVISSDSIEYDGLSHSPDITATVMVDHLNSNDFNFDSLSSDISLLTVGSIDLNHDSSGTDFSLNLFYDSQLMDSQYYDINVTVSGNGIFEITLADLYVDYGEKTLVYDGSGHDLADPGLFAVSGLKENDSLMFDQLIKSETGTYEMDSLISGYQIIGSDIQSRNNCYNLIVTGQVELYQIQITVTQTGGQWTYDGCLHQPTMTYVASDLSQQLCSISVVSNIGFTKAGTYQIPSSYSSDDYTIVVKQKSDNRIIPNDCLNIMVDTVGDCVINKADLDIDFGSHSYIYDGQEYDFSSLTNYQIQGLETTDTLIIDEAVYVNKGTYDFSNENYMPVFHILNQENEDVKFCYNINFTGTLVLKSAVLTIDFTSESTTITYDGLNHYFTFTYSLDDEFASDYAVNVNNLIFFKNAGIYYAQAGDDDFDISFTNLLNPSRVLDSSFVQILIVSSDAVFTIEKKAIVLDFENWVLMYTGREYSITDLGNKAFAAGNSLLASNDSLVFASADKYLNLGSYDMGNISVSVVDSEGQDMTGNYSFGFLNSSITIERAILSISASGNQAIIYDGKAHYYSLNYEFDSRFASDYSVSVVSVGYTTVGEYALGRDSFIITVTSNVDSYIIDSDCLIVNISTVSNDSISISKCDLTLDFGTNNFIYDGNSYSVWDYLITNETLTTNGDTIDNHPDYSLTEMGEYDLSSFDFSSISIIDSEGENRTSCYNLLIEGVIKICQGRLTITVENSTYVYDGQSHYLIITSYDFSGFESHSGNNQFSVEIDVASSISLINVGRVDVLSQENLSFIVRDSNDEVISNEYIDLVVISDTPNLPYIEITPYELEIDLSSNTRIYTGNDYSVNEFLKTYQTTFGDTITISNGLTASLAEIGSYDFSSFDIEYHILSTLGADITPNYSVSFTGDLEIIRAEINFINDDLEFTYTGQLIELSLQNFPHTDNLPAGYSVTDMACNNGNYLVGQYAFEDLSVTQLTITFNDIPVTFKTDFHDFVSISFSNNSLIINKAILNVDLSNTIKDVYYDGTTYAIEDIIPLSAFEICSTDRISIGYEETLAFGENEIINHVTTFEIGLSKGLSYSIIHQTDGADVTFCYQMNFTDVSFSITQIYIELTVSNDSKVYDGQVLSYMSGPSYSCLMPGDLAVFTLSTPSSDFGDYQMTLDNLTFVISDSDGKVLFSSEYKRDYVIIDLQPVTFSITKADLVLNFETTIRPYAGHSYGFSDIYDFDEIVNSALPSLLMNKASLVFDSTIEFQFENGVDTNYDLSLYLNNLKVFLNSVTDITSNFNISLAGTFSVISCSLSFDFGSENETYNQKIYDGENFSPSSLENYLVQTNLPTRYQVLVLDINNSKAVSGTDYGLYVGTYDYLYECISFEVRDEKGNVVFYHHFDNDEDCSHLNLSIAGKFEISERPIQIGSDSTLIYTGNIYDVSFLFKNTDPAPDDSISYSFTYPTLSQTTTYSNDEIFDFTIKNTAGFDVTSNYVITISGSITFLVVNLSVDVTEPTRYYDGKGFSAEDLILSSGNLPEGYLFSCEGDFSFVEAGQYQLDSSLITIHLFDALGEEIIFANGNAYDYINCTFVTDTMTINPTPLTISLSQTTHVYDGQKADLNSLIEYELGNPALSQINIEAVGYYSDLIDVGVYQLTEENLSISINNGYRIYVSDNSNFEITFLTSQFEITKKTLVLNFGQQTTYYSGENIYVSYYQTLGYENGIITSDENSDLVSGQTIFFDEYGNEKFYEIGTYDFSLTDYLPKIRITDSETKETTSNYDITIIGSITIEKLSIELTIVSQVLTYSSSYPTIRYVVSGGSILADGRYEVSGSSTLNYFNVGTYGYSDLGPMTISAMFEGKTVEMKEENMTITIKGTERFTCVIKKATIYVSTQSIFSEYQGEINTLESSYLGGFTVKNGFRAARVMYLTDSGELDAVGNHYRTSYSGNENNIYDNTIVDDVSRLVIAESRYDSNNNYFLADATANYNVVYQFGKIYFEVY